LETYIEAEGIWWEDPVIRSLDLEYHNVDPEQGLFYALEQGGQMRRIVTDAQIEAALTQPPPDTRAALRGDLVRRFSPEIGRVSWGRVGFKQGSNLRWQELAPEDGARVPHLRGPLETAKTVAEALAGLSGPAVPGE
jgi:proteasome accessory factor A